jgi:hypothetical protein
VNGPELQGIHSAVVYDPDVLFALWCPRLSAVSLTHLGKRGSLILSSRLVVMRIFTPKLVMEKEVLLFIKFVGKDETRKTTLGSPSHIYRDVIPW